MRLIDHSDFQFASKASFHEPTGWLCRVHRVHACSPERCRRAQSGTLSASKGSTGDWNNAAQSVLSELRQRSAVLRCRDRCRYGQFEYRDRAGIADPQPLNGTGNLVTEAFTLNGDNLAVSAPAMPFSRVCRQAHGGNAQPTFGTVGLSDLVSWESKRGPQRFAFVT